MILNSIILMILCLTTLLLVMDFIPARLLVVIYVAFAICGSLMFGLISTQLSIGILLIVVVYHYMTR